MSLFGDEVSRLRAKRGATLEEVAQKVGTHKGYISGIENGRVAPPSVKLVIKLARFFKEDERRLVRLAWVDKAPTIIRTEAQNYLKWIEAGRQTSG